MRRRHLHPDTEHALDMQRMNEIDDLLQLGSAWHNSVARPNSRGRLVIQQREPSIEETEEALELANARLNR